MSEKPSDRIVEQIRKILAKTEANGCTPEEAEAAFAMASRKLAEYNLTMEDIAVVSGAPAEESWLEEAVYETGRWSLEDNLCYGILKEFYFVEGVLNRRNGKKVFLLFGTAENVAVGRHVWNALRAAFNRCWTTYRTLNKRPANERRLFISGMADGFSQKLRDERAAQVIERDLVRGGAGTALALVSIAEKTEKKFNDAHGRDRRHRYNYTETVGDRSTLRAGYEAGRALNLNREIAHKGQKGIGR